MIRKLLSNNFTRSFILALAVFFLLSGKIDGIIEQFKEKIENLYQKVTSISLNDDTADSVQEPAVSQKRTYITKEDVINGIDFEKGKEAVSELTETAGEAAEDAIVGYFDVWRRIGRATYVPLDIVLEKEQKSDLSESEHYLERFMEYSEQEDKKAEEETEELPCE